MNGRATLPTSEAATASECGETWYRVPETFSRRTPRGVLVAGRDGSAPMRLEGAALTVWEELTVPRSTSQLVAILADRLEQRADGLEPLATAALEVLVAAGVVAHA